MMARNSPSLGAPRLTVAPRYRCDQFVPRRHAHPHTLALPSTARAAALPPRARLRWNRKATGGMAAVAEHEALMISDRTRAALQSAKAPRRRAGTAADSAKARQAKSAAAAARVADLAPVITDIRAIAGLAAGQT
jgi:hypothetical protein